jgi:hypothetical protein
MQAFIHCHRPGTAIARIRAKRERGCRQLRQSVSGSQARPHTASRSASAGVDARGRSGAFGVRSAGPEPLPAYGALGRSCGCRGRLVLRNQCGACRKQWGFAAEHARRLLSQTCSGRRSESRCRSTRPRRCYAATRRHPPHGRNRPFFRFRLSGFRTPPRRKSR